MTDDHTNRRWEPDRPYCPHCKESKWNYQHEAGICTDCGEPVQNEWPTWQYLKYLAYSTIAKVFWAVLLFGPVAYGIYILVSGVRNGRPLIATRTVQTTTTELYGVAFEAAGLFILALFIWMVLMYMTVGPRP